MLQIKPSKFKVLNLNIGPISGKEVNLERTKLDLNVEAIKAGDSAVSVLLNSKLLLENDVLLELCYSVTFDVKEFENDQFVVVDQTLTDPFIQVNAAAIAYPFLRAFVSTICINAGYNSILLPPVNFQALFNEKKRKGEEASSKIMT